MERKITNELNPWSWLVQTRNADAWGRDNGYVTQDYVGANAIRPSPRITYTSDSGRPADCYGIPWCGCWLRHHFGLSDKGLNLALNWRGVGRATSPHVGAVVVWPWHVGVIVGGGPGAWEVQSGNFNHRVATAVVSLRGAVAFRDL